MVATTYSCSCRELARPARKNIESLRQLGQFASPSIPLPSIANKWSGNYGIASQTEILELNIFRVESFGVHFHLARGEVGLCRRQGREEWAGETKKKERKKKKVQVQKQLITTTTTLTLSGFLPS